MCTIEEESVCERKSVCMREKECVSEKMRVYVCEGERVC